MIRCLMFMSNLTFWNFAKCCQFLISNINVKNDIFYTCSRESAKCKMTAQARRKRYHIFINIWTFQLGLLLKSRFLGSDIFLFSLSNKFILQEVCFLCILYIHIYTRCIQYIQYSQYILTTPIYFKRLPTSCKGVQIIGFVRFFFGGIPIYFKRLPTSWSHLLYPSDL